MAAFKALPVLLLLWVTVTFAAPQLDATEAATETATEAATETTNQTKTGRRLDFDKDEILGRVNFYRRVYNSPDATWSWSAADLARQATEYLCRLGRLEHSGPAEHCSIAYGFDSVTSMVENWCENGQAKWGQGPTEAKLYCDRGYYNNPQAAEVNYWHVGHFSSVVWASATKVGAAIHYCPNDGHNYLAFCNAGVNMAGAWGTNMNCPQDWQGYTGSLNCNTC